jgi:hypothetical protein
MDGYERILFLTLLVLSTLRMGCVSHASWSAKAFTGTEHGYAFRIMAGTRKRGVTAMVTATGNG